MHNSQDLLSKYIKKGINLLKKIFFISFDFIRQNKLNKCKDEKNIFGFLLITIKNIY